MYCDMKSEKENETLRQKFEGILNSYSGDYLTKDEAIKALIDCCLDYAIRKIDGLCRIVIGVRSKQKEYFETKNSKVLQESKRLEKDLDNKLNVFEQLRNRQNNPELPFKNQ